MVGLNKTSTLILHNLKKAKGQYTSFGLIICLTAFIMNIALVLAFQTFHAYDSRFSELDTADINFLIPQFQDDGEIIDEIKKIDGVSAVEKHGGIFVSATVREFADSDFDMNTVFYNLNEKRTLNRLDISEEVKKTKIQFIYQCICGNWVVLRKVAILPIPSMTRIIPMKLAGLYRKCSMGIMAPD